MKYETDYTRPGRFMALHNGKNTMLAREKTGKIKTHYVDDPKRFGSIANTRV
jgi:hypothetical protein